MHAARLAAVEADRPAADASRTARPARPGRPARRRTPRPRATARPTTCGRATASSSAETAAGVAWCGPGGRRGRGRGPRTAGPCPCPHHASAPQTPAPRAGVRRPARPTVAAWATALLEVTVLGPRDVAGADEGGADRLHLVARDRRPVARSPRPGLRHLPRDRAAGVRAAAAQRLLDHHRRRADPPGRAGRGLPRLRRGGRRPSASSTPTSRSTPRSASTSPPRCPSVPWTFHRAVDDTLDPRRSWRRLLDAARPGRGPVGRLAARARRSGTTTCSTTAESDPRDRARC